MIYLDEVLLAVAPGRQRGAADVPFTSFHTDSRTVRPGGLFFALQGADMDGHRFVPDAVGRGAAGVVVAQPVNAQGAAVVRVEDTWAALYDLARWRLEQVAPLVVGVTGSNGKTSTKELTAAVLGTRQSVLRTEGNLNTETGVPLTILQLEPEHTALVLEMGMQGPGEIARLAELARPRVGVITMIGSAHLEFFASREALARAKGELIAALPRDGLAVLNGEDAFTPLLGGLSAAPVVTYGLAAGDLRAEGYRAEPDGSRFTVEGVEVRLGIGGRHQARNAVAALAVGRFAGVPLEEGARALAEVRFDQRLRTANAPAGFRVIDDSYNASPESMRAAFETVAEDGDGRLLAVLGEMRELGAVAEDEHRAIGGEAGRTFDEVCVVDVGWGGVMAEAAGAFLASDQATAEQWVRKRAQPGDRVLVKASRGVALDRLVSRLLEL